MQTIRTYFILFILIAVIDRSWAGITTSASLGFGRYRNQNGPSNASQPVGITWGLAAGYRYDFVAAEAFYYSFSGCATNEYYSTPYKTCAKNHLYGGMARFYFQDLLNIFIGYAQHNVTHSIDPYSQTVAQHYAYIEDNPRSGILYGLGAKKNLAANIDAFFDALVCAIGNGGDKVSSENDLFMAGIRLDF